MKEHARRQLKEIARSFDPCYDKEKLKELYARVFVERAFLILSGEYEAADSLGEIQEKIKNRLKGQI